MRYDAVIQQTIEWIEAHLDADISTDEIIHVSGFSQYHFHRIFKESVGLSVTEYIRMRRLTNAANLLLHSDERILDIALLYQFESQESFTRAFKKLYHLPPGQYRKEMRILSKQKEELVMEQVIKGWNLRGTAPYNYEIGIDYENVHQGRAAGYLKSVGEGEPAEFATMMQEFKAEQYKGQRIKLSGYVKTQDVAAFAGLWMRVDNDFDEVMQFDNMSDRPIFGTNSWNRYSIVLDVPANSAVISFGVLLNGPGMVWLDGLNFEVVNKNTPTTNIDFESHLMDEPTNLSFEE